MHFTLGKVVLFPYYYNYLLGLFITVPAFLLYGIYGINYLGTLGLAATFLLSGFVIVNIIKHLSKSVTIYFDEQYMYIVLNGTKTKKYLKKEITGFYSYNYEGVEKSFISIQFHFKNNQKLELTDIDITEKLKKEKALLLKSFLKIAKKELGFNMIEKNRARSLQKLGAIWYSSASPASNK